MKIRDRVVLGITAGVLAGIPARLVNNTVYKIGLTDRKYGQMAASLFLPTKKQRTHRMETRLVGSLTDRINCSMMGIAITYLLSATGRDNAVLKGVTTSSVAWMTLYGITSKLGLVPPSRKPWSSVFSFADHAIFGGLCALLVANLGHPSLFPDGRRYVPLAQPTTAPVYYTSTPEFTP